MSRFARFRMRASQTWARLRTNPYVERYEQVRRRNEDPELDDVPDEVEEEFADADEVEPPDPEGVPHGVKVAAGWSWRALVIAAAVVGVLYLASILSFVVIPILVSLLLAAMLQPLVALLVKAHVPRSIAAAIVLIAGIAAVAGVLTLVINQFVANIDTLVDSVQKGLLNLQDWAKYGPLHLEQKQINNFFSEFQTVITDWLSDNQSILAGTAVESLGIVFNILTGAFLVLFTTFFFMRDGRRIWTFLVRMLPERAHEPLLHAGFASWRTLVSFVRATILVAFIDAVGIGAWLMFLDIELAIPLAALVFLGAFIPIIGATVSGIVAVLVALVGDDWVTALLVLAGVIVVQQVEGHLLQPLLMGRAVSVHPLAIVLAVAAGVVLAGPIGALIAVPIVAVLNNGIKALRAHAHPPDETPGNVAA
ncbi:AI-2E family transporter [Stackebrandtia nassauensis]|uniref:AI-2E family transporter n=1 Tax=Stackebrandtia nassauensis (strain DSM 44728 / CIP 108903 / NRRL B-16338 / NBRC 102104 / LLR-40K-21) TaxID=446470 RepID=D3Q2Y7_STANL|nr:AI-2E family transporter [Stackebrandtia nassauensis]ADD39957.1 protein of unknown function UPF0118 [Stackebrandtia nassauensis DSM 44728]